jgi:iron(III) transport system ATP-binding protein
MALLNEPMLRLDDIHVAFGPILAVDGVSLDVARGEMLCLVGPSGSGKSTLLRVVAGLERPDRGRVAIDGACVDGPTGFVPPEQRRVGVVFQDYALFPHLTVAGNVAFGLAGRPRVEVDRTVASLLDRVGLSRYARSYPHMLSGGERQRVALARALAPSPRVLLMDEPFSSLDGRLRESVRDATVALLRETGTTAVVVTHDPAEALRLGDRVALLRDGRLVQCDVPEAIYLRPASVFAARFFGDVNELASTCVSGAVDTPFGRVDVAGIADRSPVAVCIRPQDLHMASGPTALRGRVIDTTFREGWHDVAIELEWAGATTRVSLHTRNTAPPSRGEAIHLHADPARVVIATPDPATATL